MWSSTCRQNQAASTGNNRVECHSPYTKVFKETNASKCNHGRNFSLAIEMSKLARRLTNWEREHGSRVPAAILKVAEYESQSKA